MFDEDVALARKRGRRFTCSMVAFVMLAVAIAFCSGQLASIATVTLEAAPGETAERGVAALYSIAYAAKIGNEAASTESIKFNLEDSAPIELICEDNQIYGQVMGYTPQEAFQPGTMSYFRLTNNCEQTVIFKFCWFYDSIFALQPFPPSCVG